MDHEVIKLDIIQVNGKIINLKKFAIITLNGNALELYNEHYEKHIIDVPQDQMKDVKELIESFGKIIIKNETDNFTIEAKKGDKLGKDGKPSTKHDLGVSL